MATYSNSKGTLWTISADDLTLHDGGRTRSFSSYPELLTEAEKRIRKRKKAGYVLVGNREAEAAGQRDEASEEQIERALEQFGLRASIHSDPRGEVEEILRDPEGYDGGSLVIDGNVVIDGDWDIRSYAAVVVLGNCTVKGLVYQYQTEPWLVVTGNLRARNLVMAANLDVGGDLVVEEVAEFESADGYTHVGGTLRVDTALVWDMFVTCEAFKAKRYVSHTKEKHRLKANATQVRTWIIGRQEGAAYEKAFHPCVLDYSGMEGDELAEQRAQGWQPTLGLDHREMIHLLGLPMLKKRGAKKAR